jgi:hypothetical protein
MPIISTAQEVETGRSKFNASWGKSEIPSPHLKNKLGIAIQTCNLS